MWMTDFRWRLKFRGDTLPNSFPKQPHVATQGVVGPLCLPGSEKDHVSGQPWLTATLATSLCIYVWDSTIVTENSMEK